MGFFFSSRRRHTRWTGDWSSDVCSSDLPGHPRDARLSVEVVRELGARMPILGVCLGHQVIGEVYGGRVSRAPELVHGKTSEIFHAGDGVLAGLPSPFPATRYHSLVVERDNLPGQLEVTGWTQ